MNLHELKVAELKQLGKKFQLKGWYDMKKEDLISTIEKVVSASDEALEILNHYEKENIAIAEYTANWAKYTKRYNVNEFLEKWNAGKIVLESEKAAEPKVEEKPEEKSQPKPVEKKPEPTPESEEKPEVEEEKIEPFVYKDADGEEWEDYDIGEKMMKWSDEKRAEFDAWYEKEWVTIDLDCLDKIIDAWSKDWDKAHRKTEEKKVGHPAPKRGALIEFNGKSQNICAWAKELGVSANTLYGRLYKLGWSVEKAFTKK